MRATCEQEVVAGSSEGICRLGDESGRPLAGRGETRGGEVGGATTQVVNKASKPQQGSARAAPQDQLRVSGTLRRRPRLLLRRDLLELEPEPGLSRVLGWGALERPAPPLGFTI